MVSRAAQERSVALAASLWAGVLIPFLYFGKQLAAAAFYPGYSFLNQDASTLGSSGSRWPAVFNVGSIVAGAMCVFAAWGFLRASRRSAGARPVLSGLAALALVAFGLGAVNAGLHPLPHPRHTAGPLAVAGAAGALLPLLIPAALWRLPLGRRAKALLLANLGLLVALVPVFSGLVQVALVKSGTDWPAYQHFLNAYHGLLQRVAALVVVAPIGVGCYALARHAAANPPPRETAAA